MCEANDTFHPADLRGGGRFDYENGTKVVSGEVGMVESHDNDTVHVVHDKTGCPVCSIRNGSPKIPSGVGVLIPTGERTVFKFTPNHTSL